jgi:hypothetical protein
MLVGVIITGLIRLGLPIDDGTRLTLEGLITTLITAVYYAGVRYLEVKVSPSWGWLLGWAKQPVYLPQHKAA